MFQEYFFGAAKKVLGPYGRMHSVKKNRNGRKYIEYTSKRTGNKVRKYLDSMTKSKKSPKKSPKRSPKKSRKSPKRAKGKTILCRKDLSLAKLRKLALANGINVFSEAKTAISKRTGLPKKPKMVGCSTLMKRMKEAGLSDLYTKKMVEVMPEVTPEEIPVLLPEVVPEEPVVEEEESMELGELFEEPETGDVLRLDPACASEFDKFKRANPELAKLYKGYAMGPGPCSSRAFVEADDENENADLDAFAETAGFDMSYGRRYGAGARPRKTQKHVGEIMVKGRRHMVFKGKEGGLYYMKGKSGRKVYIDMKKFKKMKLKNKFGKQQQIKQIRGA